MMNFYYDPIKGLQYEYLGEVIILDVAQIPKDFNVEQFISRWRAISRISLNSGVDFFPQIQTVGKITNYVKI